MKFDRKVIPARKDWQQKVADSGMYYHTVDDQIYWNEEAYYELDSELVDIIDDATTELHNMCIEVGSEMVSKGDYVGYEHLTDEDKTLIEKSWRNGHQHVYGRFDLGIDRDYNIKLFEYNADTPTSLLEASVVQWNWKENIFPTADQFNSIHEKLIKRWIEIVPPLKSIYFATMTDAPYEDWGNLHYLMETASLAGFNTSSINLECIGWNGINFIDLNNKPISHLFKLYPWEWMIEDEFANNILKSQTVITEPAWKMLWSNKMINVKLWEKYPEHPLLLRSFDANEVNVDLPGRHWFKKPKLGREGQGITTSSEFVHGYHYIRQEKMNVIDFNGIQPVIGSWVIGDLPAGIGIREDIGITTNNSKFVPHIFW